MGLAKRSFFHNNFKKISKSVFSKASFCNTHSDWLQLGQGMEDLIIILFVLTRHF
jgi:hypothetical protein